MGRKQLWVENVTARFAEGTLDRIRKVKRKNEYLTDFIRVAVEKELAEREGQVFSTDIGPGSAK